MNSEDRRQRFEAVAPAVIDAVRRFLARRTDPSTADDVLQDTLLVCWRRFDEILPVRPPSQGGTAPDAVLPWAYGVARNCLANAERSRRRQGRLLARVWRLDRPAEVVPAPDGPDDELTAALDALRAEDAELLRLWAWEELSPAEIAVVLGISPNAASIRLHRAKQNLREELRKTGDAAGHEESTEGSRP
ncbi:sigma-70 family RNA polymerase sigma factor [Actinoplanes sp. TRM 88003]|uniref:Sigma-70 family RNA polymerase sigma factor n=1 Tax=Paractinoplanes aksuensis TaxID=2939490 RepID=A0ABT1DH88_9ACTN|nr:sigma-70 family RNA polymerase sigma factor [Actinoplanes aksuensis]MCO8270184.1 sigma-70 family RNA polymerase sigma factor [Actinoplanes aksuensis]